MGKNKNKKFTKAKGNQKKDQGKEVKVESKEEVKDVKKTSATAEQSKVNEPKPAKVSGPEGLLSKGANAKKPSNPSATGPQENQKIAQLDGLIFMCNSRTKEDCFKFRVFGLPEAKKNIVEQITRGMKLFLFDIDLRLLYGIYKAISPGGLNLEPEAFRGVGGSFPAQVRFQSIRDTPPLPEKFFKDAIKENYYDRNKFKLELNADQVNKLFQLYREGEAAARDAGGRESRRPSRVQSISRHERDAPRRDSALGREVRARRELGYASHDNVDRRLSAADYVPPPVHVPAYAVDPVVPDIELHRFEHGRDAALIPTDLFQRENLYSTAYSGQLEGRGYGFDLSVDAPLLRKRALEEAYADELALHAPKRALVHQDELYFRDVDYNQGARRNPWEDHGLMHTVAGVSPYVGLTQPPARHYPGWGY